MTVKDAWGMTCPKCGCDKQLHITCQVTIDVLLVPNGTQADGDNGDREWDGESPCWCDACGWSGIVREADSRNRFESAIAHATPAQLAQLLAIGDDDMPDDSPDRFDIQ